MWMGTLIRSGMQYSQLTVAASSTWLNQGFKYFSGILTVIMTSPEYCPGPQR